MNASALPMLVASLPAEQRDARIMTLCDEAICRLQEARDVEEVVTIRNMAEAFALYTRKMKAALEAQNQCQLVVLLAEARIGAELKAAQERKEIGAQGRRSDLVPAGNEVKPTITEAGITRKQAMNAKRLAALGEERIREAVREANEAGERLTRSALLARDKPLVDLKGTPPEDFALATKAWGSVRDFAAFCRRTDAQRAASAIRNEEADEMRDCARAIGEWLDAFIANLPGEDE